MSKQIVFNDDVYKKLIKGVEILADAVTATLGPKGRYVVLDQKFGYPIVTNDGVTIAKEINLEDPFENIGAQLVKEVSIKTNEVAGDGTTTAVALAWGLVKEGFRNVIAGANPTLMKLGMERALEIVVAELRKQAKLIDLTDVEKARKELQHIASISASETDIGAMVADALIKVGKDGVITVEEGRSLETVLEVVEGMQFDRGFISPYFVTDPARMEAVLEDPYFIFVNSKINSVMGLAAPLDKIYQTGKPFVLVSNDVDGEVLPVLVVNKLQGKLRCVAVKSPGFGDQRLELLEDLAVLTGGTVITEEKGINLKGVSIGQLGRASKVIVTKDSTTIIGGKGDKKLIEDKITQLRRMSNESTSDFEKEKVRERIAKLTGGVAVISVGGATESECKARKYKVEDALNATRAAVEEGIVAGGGTALLRAMPRLDAGLFRGFSTDEIIGIKMVQAVLKYPFLKIIENAGQDGSVIMARIKQSPNVDFGYNALTGEYGNLFEMGVIDPVKVTRSALQHAISVVGLMLTTNVLITEKKEIKNDTHSGS